MRHNTSLSSMVLSFHPYQSFSQDAGNPLTSRFLLGIPIRELEDVVEGGCIADVESWSLVQYKSSFKVRSSTHIKASQTRLTLKNPPKR